jgi:hypothetical protein
MASDELVEGALGGGMASEELAARWLLEAGLSVLGCEGGGIASDELVEGGLAAGLSVFELSGAGWLEG